ncbi:YvrJ family protein [Irregularibacter muris]|uniref:YvrJ family protein n=1 Tax=Irregularibacter muris TaxID=1796619 RepID=A0AAE3HGW3_9FIRM|nr:YvrJ family protein [Irregularibacter muris]MCR1899966.1 YvrJ family protein [Irregularibacter muris]
MEELFSNLSGNIAFPILVTSFLLTRVEKKLDQLNTTIINLMELVIRQKDDVKGSNYDE